MKSAFASDVAFAEPRVKDSAPSPALTEFRARFQRSLRRCVNKGFSVEEAFGMIWEEVLDEFRLSENDQGVVYEELIDWARGLRRT